MVGGCLATDANMTAVAARAGNGELQHLEHPRILLVEIEGDDLGVAVDPERELGQVVGADGEAVEALRRRRRSRITLLGISHMT